MTDIAYLPAHELARMIRDRQIGALELLDHLLARVERHNPTINAVVTFDLERARARARDADAALGRGELWGPFHGLPMTVKEAFDVEGLVTSWGSPLFKDNVARETQGVARKLVDAGAIVYGKTNVPVRLTDWQTFNPLFGTTNNPYDPSRAPGGSSGGAAAALASGMTPLEVGSDIGGSIRNPAHFCGVCGHKPSYGALPQEGHWLPGAHADPDINVVGPMARTVADLERALEVMGGANRFDRVAWRLELPPPRASRLRDFRVAVMLEDRCCEVDRSIQDRIQAVADRLARAGAKVDDRARPAIDTREGFALFVQLLRGVTTSVLTEDEHLAFRQEAERFSMDDDSYAARGARAAVQSHREWFAANEARNEMRLRWGEFFRDFDVLLCPVAASPAYPHDQERPRPARRIEVNGHEIDYNHQIFWAGFFGVSYLPGTVIPMGLTDRGLPVGLQIVGPYLEDRTTLALGALLEGELDGFTPPPGFA
ncbi:MAG TPA: amidase [Geminicoccaceae bacterium]